MKTNQTAAKAPGLHEPARFSSTQFRFYEYFLSAFVVILLISNLVGQKLVAFDLTIPFSGTKVPFLVSSAQLLFPLTYLFGDIFTEIYGYAGSRRAIWMGFFANLLMSVLLLIIVPLPPAPTWHNQAAFETVFTQVPRLVAASLIAFWAGEFTNSFVLAKMKVWSGSSNRLAVWSRFIGSTAAGQLVDTILLVIIGFAGTQPVPDLIKIVYSGYLAKVVYEAVMTPITGEIVAFIKRVEGVDVYDRATDFSPFKI